MLLSVVDLVKCFFTGRSTIGWFIRIHCNNGGKNCKIFTFLRDCFEKVDKITLKSKGNSSIIIIWVLIDTWWNVNLFNPRTWSGVAWF